jgi:hypothetical protein
MARYVYNGKSVDFSADRREKDIIADAVKLGIIPKKHQDLACVFDDSDIGEWAIAWDPTD